MKKIKPNKLILLPIIALALLLLAVALRPKQAAVAPDARLVRQVLPNPKITDFGRLSYWRDEEVQEGDTLPMVLARIGVSEQNIQDFVQNSPINLKALKLNEGKIVSARIDENQNVTDIQFFNDEDGERNLVAIEYAEGKWQMRKTEGETTTLPSLRSVVITSSVSGALGQAGVPDSLGPQDRDRIERWLETAENLPLLEDYVLAETETDREITIGATTLRCRMDAVFQRKDGSGWLIVDWKTGRRQVPVDQLSVYVHAWAVSQGVPTASVRAAYVYVDYPGGRVDELTAEGLLSIEQIQAALTVG